MIHSVQHRIGLCYKGSKIILVIIYIFSILSLLMPQEF